MSIFEGGLRVKIIQARVIKYKSGGYTIGTREHNLQPWYYGNNGFCNTQEEAERRIKKIGYILYPGVLEI